MTMLKIIATAAIGLAAGFAIATWLPGGGEPPAPETLAPRPAASSGARAADARVPDAELALRLERVEEALSAELELRASLEARVESLAAEVSAARRGEAPLDPLPQAEGAPPRERTGPGRAFGRAELTADLPERLVAAGFSTDRAQWITDRVEQLPMEALRAQYEARRGGTGTASAPFELERALRSELGDADYERYLQALGRPIAIDVRGVLASSPAEQAGLRPGDQIVAYGGQRIFDLRDMNRLTLEGTPGEPVLVDVVRDGQRMQVVVPRGPVGITGGGRFGRP